jgi:hypothetical protein
VIDGGEAEPANAYVLVDPVSASTFSSSALKAKG